MIVRISGHGQYELDDDGVRRLDELDTRLTAALTERREHEFHHALKDTIHFIEESGKRLPDDRIVPSEVIVPPEDVTLEEAQAFFSDEGLMEPLPA